MPRSYKINGTIKLFLKKESIELIDINYYLMLTK